MVRTCLLEWDCVVSFLDKEGPQKTEAAIFKTSIDCGFKLSEWKFIAYDKMQFLKQDLNSLSLDERVGHYPRDHMFG